MTYVKVRFAFQDWQRDGVSIYQTERGIDLSLGNFHSGTVFEGELALDADDERELLRALFGGYKPVFEVFAVGDHVPDVTPEASPARRACELVHKLVTNVPCDVTSNNLNYRHAFAEGHKRARHQIIEAVDKALAEKEATDA